MKPYLRDRFTLSVSPRSSPSAKLTRVFSVEFTLPQAINPVTQMAILKIMIDATAGRYKSAHRMPQKMQKRHDLLKEENLKLGLSLAGTHPYIMPG